MACHSTFFLVFQMAALLRNLFFTVFHFVDLAVKFFWVKDYHIELTDIEMVGNDLFAARQKTAPGKGFFQNVGGAGITDQTVLKPVDAKRTVPLDQIQMIELIENCQRE